MKILKPGKVEMRKFVCVCVSEVRVYFRANGGVDNVE